MTKPVINQYPPSYPYNPDCKVCKGSKFVPHMWSFLQVEVPCHVCLPDWTYYIKKTNPLSKPSLYNNEDNDKPYYIIYQKHGVYQNKDLAFEWNYHPFYHNCETCLDKGHFRQFEDDWEDESDFCKDCACGKAKKALWDLRCKKCNNSGEYEIKLEDGSHKYVYCDGEGEADCHHAERAWQINADLNAEMQSERRATAYDAE